MSLSPFEHPFLSGLFADPELAALFSAEADIAAMVRFEIALAEAEADCGIVPTAAAEAIAGLGETFVPDLPALAKGVGRDGVVAPELVKQLRAALDPESAKHLHFASTSQDVIDTSLVLRLKSCCAILEARLEAVIALIDDLSARFGANPLMARTRMQDALVITVGDRLADWKAPLERHRERLAQLKPRLLVLQFGGPVGTLDRLGPDGPRVAFTLADKLGLGVREKSWHSQRDGIAEFASWLALVSGSLGKIGQDVALMAQNAVGDIRLSGGGGSSALAHKSNPVAAEVLVTLARYVAGAGGTAAQALVHEQERSGAAWTLEWLVLPQAVVATGSALLLARRLLDSVETMGRG